MILEPIFPQILSVRQINYAHTSILEAYGADPEKHQSLGLVTCDQDDPLYVALDEATKQAPVDVVFARSFYAGAAHSSGRLSGEILGVIAASDPDEVEEGLRAIQRVIDHDACFYSADANGDIAVFPHVITSLGYYLSAEADLSPGDAMAYLVAPPLEATIGFDAAAKAADVSVAKIFTPPSETNFAAAWYSGSIHECESAAEAFAEAVVDVGRNPFTI